MRWRIIGIGSPWGDDAAGWRVVEQLRARLGPQDRVELLRLDRPGMGLLQFLKGADGVILIDAVRSGQPLGTLHRLSLEQAERLPKAISSHGLGLGETLRLARVLGALPKTLEIYGIELDRLEGEGLSTAVAQTVAALAGELGARFSRVPTGPCPTCQAPSGG